MTTPQTPWRKPAIQDCAGLLVLWLFMLACTMPNGNFPLNDDWNYAWSVRALIDEHRLIITHWSLAASLPHIVLGWLTCSVFGFSFAALRAVSMFAGYVSTVCAYLLCKRAGASRFPALLAAIVWMTNPVFFNLSTTFMTDVTFMMIAALTIGAFSKIAETKELRWSALIFAGLLSILMSLTRQTGLVIPLGFLLSKKFTAKAWVPAVAAIAAVVIFQNWLNATVGPLQSYQVERAWIEQIIAKGPAYIMSNTMSNLICAFIYIGLFLFPLLLVTYPALLKTLDAKSKRSALIMFAEPVILLAVGLIMTHSIMPLGDNILFNLGLGPVLLGGEGPAHYVTAPSWFWVIVTICGVAGAGALVSTLLVVVSRMRPLYAFLLCSFVLYMTVISFRGFFDRYLIFPMFLLIPILASIAPPPTARLAVLKPIGVLFVLLFGVFSISGTHDYFAWNRARWEAAHDLVDVEGVSPMEIDGGLEFNGWYGYEPKFRESGGVVMNTSMTHGDEYLITTRTVPNYEITSRYSYQRWLPWGGAEIIVLHKLH